MRTTAFVASTIMLFSAPSSGSGHAIRPAPIAARVAPPHIKVASAPTAACRTPDPGWVAWYPGQVAPYPLWGSTADSQVYYSAPPGYVVLVFRVVDDDGYEATANRQVLLSDWCP